MLKLYNQLTKKEVEFSPQNPKEVKIYTCGPTVYSYAHIGNLTSYIYWDLLIRVLKQNGYIVKRALNLTDVGHLSSDADEGEDKLEKGASREGKTVWEIAEKYINAFIKDYNSLNLIKPEILARATEYIPEEENLVNSLIEKGYTYELSDGLYFDTKKFKDYAKFANLDLDNLKAGARITYNTEKHNTSDFAVWKFIKPGENHAMKWDYLGKEGYPGWHLECAAIIRKTLGGTIDIHTGGIDHIPVHHTNEIAEYEAAYNQKLSNYWLHCNFITIDGEKISKSLGNTYTLSDLAKRKFSPLDFKMWVLQGHYRSERNFSFKDLESAKVRLLSWRNRIVRCYQESTKSNFSKDEIIAVVNNNLNSSEVLAKIDNSTLDLDDWKFVDELLGLRLINSSPDINDKLYQKIQQRENARKAKDYATSDDIRAELAKNNICVLDTKSGPIWQYLK